MPVAVPNEPRLTGHYMRLILAATLAGILTGILGSLFRISLDQADRSRAFLVKAAYVHFGSYGWIAVVLMVTLCVMAARYLVLLEPMASGSGVQLVEAIMRGDINVVLPRVVPVKFIGGVLAIGSGLALGREGPTVQMGGAVGGTVARSLRLEIDDLRMVQGAAAGAGLAVAFNSPLGGTLFVFEELSKQFSTRLAIITLLACGMAIAVSRLIIGNHAMYPADAIHAAPFRTIGTYAIFGLLLGGLGVLYNRVIIASIRLFDHFAGIPAVFRAGLIGVAVGLLAWFHPAAVGGGETINERLLNQDFTLYWLIMIILCRWFLGPVSYAAGTPGGIFAPLLVIGALAGQLFALLLLYLVPDPGLQPNAVAMVGMAAFFAGVVRAPLTGIVLVVEMTANTALIIPLLVASASAVLAAETLRGEPIYDTLRLRMMRTIARAQNAAPSGDGTGTDRQDG